MTIAKPVAPHRGPNDRAGCFPWPMSLQRCQRSCAALSRDERGGPAIEFALAAPIILLMLATIAEFGMYMLVTVTLEGSLRDVARYGITGQTPQGNDRIAYMLQIIAAGTHGLVDINDVVLQIKAYPTFEDVGQGEDYIDANGNGAYDPGETFKDCNGNGARDSDRGTDGTGASGQVVVYRIDYDWPMLTTMLSTLIGHAGTLHISASTVVRNEPWDSISAGSTPQSCSL